MNGANSQYGVFTPFEDVAGRLLSYMDKKQLDGAHDIAHIARVWKNARAIMHEEGGDALTVLAAIILHDCVVIEKNLPLRSQASTLSAREAGLILTKERWTPKKIDAVVHAIKAHSYSARIIPKTLEAKILQDADRLDAMGAVGVARCFYVAGRIGSSLYDLGDPKALTRAADDTHYALDHFYEKLLKLESGFQTETGALLAHERGEILRNFLDEFLKEI